MAGTRHDPDSELLALGIANIVTPFLGASPRRARIAPRDQHRSGARRRWRRSSSLTVLARCSCWPAIGYLPMAGLAALLLLVA